MSNSVVFLLIAVGLSLFGTFVVWLHGRPRRPKSSVDVFNRSLRALATNESHREPLSGVTVRPIGDEGDVAEEEEEEEEEEVPAPAGEPEAPTPARSSRRSPRPSPRPAAPQRSRPSREGADPGT